VNGILITGFPSPMGRIESFPPKLVNDLRSHIGEYKLDVPVENEDYEGMDETRFIKEVYRITNIRAKATFHLMENYDWDFFMTVFTSLDRLQHVFYGYYDRQSPLHDSNKDKILKEYYKRLDGILGDILSTIEESTHLIIVSDHGFDHLQKHVGLNNLLAAQDYLKHKASYLNREKLKRLWRLSRLFRKVIQALPVELVNSLQALTPSMEDYRQSKAYCDYPNTITLRKDLEPEMKMQLSKKITDYLYNVRDSYNNQKIVEEVFAKENILSGNLEEAPDLFILFKRGYEPKRWTKDVVQRIESPLTPYKTIKTGAHSSSYARRGFFSVSGKSIKKNFFCCSSILDIAPTILHMLGTAIPSDIDGNVLTQIFREDSSITKREIQYTTPSTESLEEQYSYSEEEKESIRRRLERLGYF
jgi:predicted AlkP superfamily phosphohydrolase/phosphomutase